MKILFILLITYLSIYSQEVSIDLNTKIGQSNNYNILVKNVQDINGNQTSNNTIYNVSHKLVESSADGLYFSWRINKYEISKDIKGVSRELEKLNEGLEIKYYTTPNGIYKSIDNWDEILNFYQKKLEKIEADFWGDEDAKSFVQSIKKNLLTPEKLSEYLLTELMLFHNFYGARLELNNEEVNTLKIQDEYLSIEIPIINRALIKKDKSNYVLEINESIDQMRANQIINDFTKKENIEKISYSNLQNFLYSYNSRFEIVDIQYSKNVIINNQKMSKFVQISLSN